MTTPPKNIDIEVNNETETQVSPLPNSTDQDTETSELIVYVHPWWEFIQAWFQKQLSILASAKTLLTLVIIYLAYYLVTSYHTTQIVVGDQIKNIYTPIITGTEWTSLMKDLLVAYLAARIFTPVIRKAVDKFTK